MKSRAFRTFEVDGVMYRFSTEGFNSAISKYRMRSNTESNSINIGKIINILADRLNVSTEAVKNWRRGYNGPADVNIIKAIADVLGCEMKVLLDDFNNSSAVITDIQEVEMTLTDTNEKNVIISILNDLIKLIDKFSENHFLCDYRMKEARGDAIEIKLEYYVKWTREIGLKLRQNSYYISRSNYEKIYTLFIETTSFIDLTYRLPERWDSICMGFCLMREITVDSSIFAPETVEEAYYENGEFIFGKELGDYLENEYQKYNGDYGWIDTIGDVFVLFMPDWYLEVVRHDFPELFVD